MTSTSSLPETSFPPASIEPAQIAKDQGTEALKDIAYGSVRYNIAALAACGLTDAPADRWLPRKVPRIPF